MKSSALIRTLALVTGALALALLGYYLTQRPKTHQKPFEKAADSAERISVQASEGSIELIRTSSTWRVQSGTATASYPADSARVQQFLGALKKLELKDVISERAATAPEFELHAASATHVTLYGKDNARLESGLFGKQARDFVHSYFKFSDQQEIYLAQGAARGELGRQELAYWRDRSLIHVAEGQILTVQIQGPSFQTALARSSDTWTVNGKLAEPTSVWGMLGILAHLQAQDFVDPAKHPNLSVEALQFAKVTLQMTDGSVHELRIGRMDPQTKRYPVASGKDLSVAWLAETNVQAILRKPSDFPLKK